MKNVFNVAKIEFVAKHISREYTDFDKSEFSRLAADNIENRELKDRGNQICIALKHYLPNDYLTSLAILLSTLHPLLDNQDIIDIDTDNVAVGGWMILPYSQFVAECGQDYLSESLDALRIMTKLFSSEFGIRYFLIQQPEQCLPILKHWCDDPCYHVRRLVSEGTRPLLPWAMQLPKFKNDPSLILPMLELLKNDSSEYVRRSVANHLNDIAKHHPDLVANIAQTWLVDANKDRQRLVKHACRTLIKQGHQQTLLAFGYVQTEDVSAKINLSTHQLNMGETLEITVTLHNPTQTNYSILMDYAIYHKKANGKLTSKVFKWKELKINAGETQTLTKKHTIKPISTRKYYAGEHKCSVLVNGQEKSTCIFELII